MKVAEDEDLRKLYPNDLEPSRYWLAMFLAQYWGGPAQYSDTRGHPRLRMRHMHLEVGIQERDLWFRHMRASLLEANLEVDLEKKMLDYFQMAADHLINSD
jgi:hemoglobin